MAYASLCENLKELDRTEELGCKTVWGYGGYVSYMQAWEGGVFTRPLDHNPALTELKLSGPVCYWTGGLRPRLGYDRWQSYPRWGALLSVPTLCHDAGRSSGICSIERAQGQGGSL